MIRYLLPAVAMMLGWGLRGFIGGGPFGAMIPGAMVWLSLEAFTRRRDVSLMAAFAAVGVGFGGEETYGQTVGFVTKPETFWWGALGLALKGGVWGALAAGVIALGTRATVRRVAVAALLVLTATELGWRLVNQPKWIYFSNLLDKPREEIWAGFLLAALALAGFLGAWRAAAWAALGGFVGFGLGGVIHGVCNIYGAELKLHSWKYMEFCFGFFFGLALAQVRWPEMDNEAGKASWWREIAGAAAMTAWLFYGADRIPVRYGYVVAAAPALVAVTRWPWMAKHLAYTVTFTAFAFDLARYGKWEAGYGVAIAAAIAFAFVVRRYFDDAGAMLEWLMWSAVGVALWKFQLQPGGLSNPIAAAFVGMAAMVSWMLRRRQTARDIASGMPSHSNLSKPSMSRTSSASL